MVWESKYKCVFVAITAALFLLLNACGGGSGSERDSIASAGFPDGENFVTFSDMSSSLHWNEPATTWSSSWGHLGGDAYPDLLFVNHGPPGLFSNNAGHDFVDQAQHIIEDFELSSDQHGSAWADWDNDGQDELLIQVGAAMGIGSDPNRYYRREGDGSFRNMASALGLDLPTLRGRTPLPVDLNSDGLLDVILTNAVSESSPGIVPLCQLHDGRFSECFSNRFASEVGSDFAVLGDVLDSAGLEVLTFPAGSMGHVVPLDGSNERPLEIRDRQGRAWSQITNVKDALVGDVNGDGLNDLVILRESPLDGIQKVADAEYGFFIISRTNEKRISLKTSGRLSIELVGYSSLWSSSNFFIGEGGYNPDCSISAGLLKCEFSLESFDIRNHGVYLPETSSNSIVSIGYSPETQQWIMHFSPDDVYRSLSGYLETQENISEISWSGLLENRASPYLLINKGQYFQASVFKDINGSSPDNCHNGVLADLDNDGDLDVYFLCKNAVSNSANQLYWNNGHGDFLLDQNAGLQGASLGRSDTVAYADYDLDGFLDLFVTNGFGPPPFNEGPLQLFRNNANDNHWLQIQLLGNTSNRDGIGSVVFVTTADKVQRRDANAGMHARAQNSRRLHFGLGDQSKIDRIIVNWQSGAISILENVEVDQILTIEEPLEPEL